MKSAGTGLLNNAAAKTGAAATSAQDPLETALEKLSPETAEALKSKLQESRDLLKKLSSGRTDMSEERKAAAAEKVRQIKEKLKALRMLAAVNPEAAARQAAQLSRELSAAVKEYAGAGGSGTSDAAMQSTGGNTALTGAEGAANQPANGQSGADASSAANPATHGENGAANAQNGAEQDTQNGEQGKDGDEKPEHETTRTLKEQQEQENPLDPEEQKQQNDQNFREKIQDEMAKAIAAHAASRADSEFADGVREIKNALKSILESAKRKLQENDDPSADSDIREGESALREVEQGLHTITSGSILPGGAAMAAGAGVSAVNLLA